VRGVEGARIQSLRILGREAIHCRKMQVSSTSSYTSRKGRRLPAFACVEINLGAKYAELKTVLGPFLKN
jgi:hypothetical protein